MTAAQSADAFFLWLPFWTLTKLNNAQTSLAAIFYNEKLTEEVFAKLKVWQYNLMHLFWGSGIRKGLGIRHELFGGWWPIQFQHYEPAAARKKPFGKSYKNTFTSGSQKPLTKGRDFPHPHQHTHSHTS